MVHPLSSLQCFNNVENIAPIASGLSSECYQVFADNQTFFAKRIASTNEVGIALHAATHSISPHVVYHDKNWLINQFVVGENLALAPLTLNRKITVALSLMAQCHQFKAKPSLLSPKRIVDDLINHDFYSTHEKLTLSRTAEQLIAQLTLSKHLVCCHGDLNFSNVIIDQNKHYLVDFECTHTAPAEYDLAMFIAVNNLNHSQLATIVEDYNKHSWLAVDQALVKHFLHFCYFINALWYQQAYQKTKLAQFSQLEQQQWQYISHLTD